MIVCCMTFIILILFLVFNKKGKFLRILDKKETNYFFLILLTSNAVALLLFAADFIGQQSEKEIVRNSYGQGTKKEAFEVTMEGELEQESVVVEIKEQEYTLEETKDMFEKVMKELDEIILGKNESSDKVEHDLNLVTSLGNYPVEIKWEFDRHDVLNIEGEILETYKEKNGTLVEVRGIITYAEEEAVFVTNMLVFPEVKTGKEKWLSEIAKIVEDQEKGTRKEKSFTLPNSVNGKEIQWSKKKEPTGYYILLLGIVAALFIPIKKVQDIHEAKKKRKEQMLRDYPDIISKFTLLLSTGMTLKNVWMKVVQTYENQKAEIGVHEAYEEMSVACREMQGGISEKEAYERFGQRCELVPYMKFAATLSQNLKKGSKGLAEILKMESIQAFENRKSIARKQGEEASTKLMIPMFGMLAIVLIIVVVPAFLSMQV